MRWRVLCVIFTGHSDLDHTTDSMAIPFGKIFPDRVGYTESRYDEEKKTHCEPLELTLDPVLIAHLSFRGAGPGQDVMM